MSKCQSMPCVRNWKGYGRNKTVLKMGPTAWRFSEIGSGLDWCARVMPWGIAFCLVADVCPTCYSARPFRITHDDAKQWGWGMAFILATGFSAEKVGENRLAGIVAQLSVIADSGVRGIAAKRGDIRKAVSA